VPARNLRQADLFRPALDFATDHIDHVDSETAVREDILIAFGGA
jgi:hypothetical protein